MTWKVEEVRLYKTGDEEGNITDKRGQEVKRSGYLATVPYAICAYHFEPSFIFVRNRYSSMLQNSTIDVSLWLGVFFIYAVNVVRTVPTCLWVQLMQQSCILQHCVLSLLTESLLHWWWRSEPPLPLTSEKTNSSLCALHHQTWDCFSDFQL